MLILYTAKVSNNEVGVSSMSQKLGLHRDLNILFSHFFLLLAPLMWSSKALSSGCEHKPLSFLLCGRNSHWRQSWFKVMGIAFCFFFLFTFYTATQLFWNWFVIVHISISREKKKPSLQCICSTTKLWQQFFFISHLLYIKKKNPQMSYIFHHNNLKAWMMWHEKDTWGPLRLYKENEQTSPVTLSVFDRWYLGCTAEKRPLRTRDVTEIN